jgi:hypothetical protein
VPNCGFDTRSLTWPICFAVQINSAHIVQHKSLPVNSEEATLEEPAPRNCWIKSELSSAQRITPSAPRKAMLTEQHGQ